MAGGLIILAISAVTVKRPFEAIARDQLGFTDVQNRIDFKHFLEGLSRLTR